jgi:hypothetical protein
MEKVANRSGISGGRSLTRPFHDADIPRPVSVAPVPNPIVRIRNLFITVRQRTVRSAAGARHAPQQSRSEQRGEQQPHRRRRSRR